LSLITIPEDRNDHVVIASLILDECREREREREREGEREDRLEGFTCSSQTSMQAFPLGCW